MMNFRGSQCLIVLQTILTVCYATNGVIWSKNRQDFVQLYSVPSYASLRAERLLRIHELETHNFQGAVIKACHHQELNMVQFYDNRTKVTGILGDMWTLLADYLNFTLVPVNNESRFFGTRLENGSYTGLLHKIHNDEIDVILRSGFYRFRLDLLRFTTPFWKTRYRLYIKPEWKYDNTWIITLLAPQTWYSIMFLLVTLAVIGYVLQKSADSKDKREKIPHPDAYTISDHFFFTFAMMCAQGFIPGEFHSRFKILSFSKSIFAWLILLAFSSHLIYRMTNRTTEPPFNDIEQLLNRTKYTILAYKGSMIYDSFSRRVQEKNDGHTNVMEDRIKFLSDVSLMYTKGCYSLKKYAIFEVEDRFMASTRFVCPLQYAGRSYYETWISSGLKKNFMYKRVIDVAIIKFHEVGLVDALRDRWLQPKLAQKSSTKFKTIDLEQVYLIFMVLSVGIVCSIVVLILEKIAFRKGWRLPRFTA